MDVNWAVISSSTYIVLNIILWDGVSPWTPPPGTFAVQSDTAAIGDIYNPDTGLFSSP